MVGSNEEEDEEEEEGNMSIATMTTIMRRWMFTR